MSDIEIRKQNEDASIKLSGRLDALCAEQNWSSLFIQLQRLTPQKLTVDASELEFLDGAGIALLLSLEKAQAQRQGTFDILHLDSQFQKLLDDSTLEEPDAAPIRETSFEAVAEDLGRAGYSILHDIQIQITFLGELSHKLILSLLRPAGIRWKNFFLLIEKAGADAIGITGLLGFLIGLILAFQSAVAMGRFSAEVYVADAIVLTMFKEMGPLITAFVLASRSGSAYAAEIGTMKVNEELDAMRTFGMDPVRFLVVPRVLALVIALPLLTLFNILFAFFGAQAVMALLGFPAIVFWDRCYHAANLADLFGGLAKTLVFGYFIAAIGCLRGLNTGKSASAVGDSATRAVVTCIVMIVVVDGVFAVLYYFLGI